MGAGSHEDAQTAGETSHASKLNYRSEALFVMLAGQYLQADLGLTVDATGRQVLLTRPQLPAFLSRVCIENLRVGPSVVDLALERHASDVGITVTRRDGPVEIVSVK